MSTEQKDLLFDVGIVVFIAAWMGWGLYRISQQRNKLQEIFKALAQRLGWEPVVTRIGSATTIQGIVQGREVQFKDFEIHQKDSNVVYGEISVVTRATGFAFTLSRLGWGDRMLEKLGDIYTKTGDSAFDNAWHMETSQPDALQALLSPELRAKLMDLVSRKYDGQFQLESGRLAYREPRTFLNPIFLSRIEGMVGLMLECADAVEVVIEKLPLAAPKSAFIDDKNSDDWGEKSPDYDDSK